MGIEDSMQRHPAGKLKRQAEKSPHSLGWALGMAKKLGVVEGEKRAEQRIIALMETLRCPANKSEHDCDDALGYTTVDDLIALIKGENK